MHNNGYSRQSGKAHAAGQGQWQGEPAADKLNNRGTAAKGARAAQRRLGGERASCTRRAAAVTSS